MIEKDMDYVLQCSDVQAMELVINEIPYKYGALFIQILNRLNPVLIGVSKKPQTKETKENIEIKELTDADKGKKKSSK